MKETNIEKIAKTQVIYHSIGICIFKDLPIHHGVTCAVYLVLVECLDFFDHESGWQTNQLKNNAGHPRLAMMDS